MFVYQQFSLKKLILVFGIIFSIGLITYQLVISNILWPEPDQFNKISEPAYILTNTENAVSDKIPKLSGASINLINSIQWSYPYPPTPNTILPPSTMNFKSCSVFNILYFRFFME